VKDLFTEQPVYQARGQMFRCAQHNKKCILSS
jgi:hypothetical protein